MTEPIFWLVCSFLLVTVCLTVVLVVAIPAFRELARAARSAEKLFDTLHRDLPPTLHSIRQTGTEINHLTEDLNVGVERASSVVKQVDETMQSAKHNVQEIQITTRSVWAGLTAAWNTFLTAPKTNHRQEFEEPPTSLPATDEQSLQFHQSSTPLEYETHGESHTYSTPTEPTLGNEHKDHLEQASRLSLDKVNSQPEQD